MDIDRITKKAVNRLLEMDDQYNEKDRLFEENFGNLQRPSFAKKYKLKEMINRTVFWSEDRQFIDTSKLRYYLNDDDKFVIKEIIKLIYQGFDGKPSTDKTLNLFKLELINRLKQCGFGE